MEKDIHTILQYNKVYYKFMKKKKITKMCTVLRIFRKRFFLAYIRG